MQSHSTKRNLLIRNTLPFRALLLLGLGILPSGNVLALQNGKGLPPAKKSQVALKKPSAKSDRPLAFKNWGILNQQDKSDIQAVEAWKLEKGRKDIIVAVIDTGVDAGHPDLKENIWDGTAKNPTKSGLFGGVSGHGWNFVKDNAAPGDDHGHGTHVAGIIGAVANPEAGVSGVAQHVSIMAVKYYSETASGTVNLANTIKAIDFAVKNGARIINYSGGGPEFSEEEYLAIRRAELAGVLIVAAAGNEHQDTDQVENYYYPSAYRLSNILSVAATDIHNRLIRSSNWGARRVDVAAPGENIYSTLPGGKYGYMTGTSQATAFVTGVAALLLSKNPKLTPVDLKKLMLENVDRFPTLVGKVATAGRINAFKALNALERRMQHSAGGLARADSPAESPRARALAAQEFEAASR
jgi:thermitase